MLLILKVMMVAFYSLGAVRWVLFVGVLLSGFRWEIHAQLDDVAPRVLHKRLTKCGRRVVQFSDRHAVRAKVIKKCLKVTGDGKCKVRIVRPQWRLASTCRPAGGEVQRHASRAEPRSGKVKWGSGQRLQAKQLTIEAAAFVNILDTHADVIERELRSHKHRPILSHPAG
jgi:hypothetical protein